MKLIAFIIAALSALILSSCHTVEGVGRDMQNAGSSLERSSIQEQNYHSHTIHPAPAPRY